MRQRLTPIDSPVGVGRRLRETRETAGLSQRKLSFPGCSAAYLSRIEHGERVPSLQLIHELAGRLGTTPDYICRGGRPLKAEVAIAQLRRWRRLTWELTGYCSLQVEGGWYAKDCLEAGVAKSKRCRICKLLGEMDKAIEEAAS